MINIGVKKETVTEAKQAIMSILDHKSVGESTKVEALKVLCDICRVTNTTISHCTFSGDNDETSN